MRYLIFLYENPIGDDIIRKVSNLDQLRPQNAQMSTNKHAYAQMSLNKLIGNKMSLNKPY